MHISIKKDKKEVLFDFRWKNVIDNRKFWKTVKPMSSNKLVSSEKITLVENEKKVNKSLTKISQPPHYFVNKRKS